MATFQERFKGKTTVMGRQGLDSVINSCNQPISKNYEGQMYINQQAQRGLQQQQQLHQISYQQAQIQKPQQQQQQQQQHQQISQQSTSNPYQHNPYQIHDSIEYATYQMNSPQQKYNHQSQQQQQQQYQYQQETRKTEIHQRSQSAKQQQNEDLSKYQPYTLKDYEVMKKTANAKLGGLGPNTYSDEWVKEKEKQIKRVEFAEQVRQFNSANIITNRNRESRQQEPNARMKAMEFAKNIPRPKPVQKVQKREETKQELKSDTKMNVNKDPFDDEIARLEREHLKYLNQLDKIK